VRPPLEADVFSPPQPADRPPPFPAQVPQTKCSMAVSAMVEPDQSRCKLAAVVAITNRELIRAARTVSLLRE
jgi:hypothetical protein